MVLFVYCESEAQLSVILEVYIYSVYLLVTAVYVSLPLSLTHSPHTHKHTHTYVPTEMPDPFAKIVVDGSGQCHSTDIIKSTLDPKWNQHYDL